MRFDTQSKIFALKPVSQKRISKVFKADPTRSDHQIGACQVYQDQLYVGVGDALKRNRTQDIDVTYGKVLRMDLDGKPLADNPFYQSSGPEARNYVWAYGLRNPFGMKIVDGQVFVTDNGPSVDRFIEIHKGENYLNDGSNWSIAARADYLFSPAVSPLMLDIYREGQSLFPTSYVDSFFIALSGHSSDPPGPGRGHRKSIVVFKYDWDRHRVASVPKPFLRYHGNGRQLIVGLAFGPDGLYFVPLIPNRQNISAIYKVQYAPDRPHPYGLSFNDPKKLMAQKNCYSCHRSTKAGPGAPSLDRDVLAGRLARRLNSETYAKQMAQLDARESGLTGAAKAKRQEVLEATGPKRVRLWMKNYLLNPQFDNPHAQMPNMGLTEREATIITRYLLRTTQKPRHLLLYKLLGRPKYTHTVIAFVLGWVFACLALFLWKRYKNRDMTI